ncbi:MAG: hypothetical protein P4L84_09560 [Isosphaeraceae bacterium]|nr:hypothetical protein [Isosphaeraceae bacterium]
MSQSSRTPKLGDIVLYHQNLRQDIWDAPQSVTWPAIVTEVLPPHAGEHLPRLRLTAFRPFDKPLWDIEAYFSEAGQQGTWSWRPQD